MRETRELSIVRPMASRIWSRAEFSLRTGLKVYYKAILSLFCLRGAPLEKIIHCSAFAIDRRPVEFSPVCTEPMELTDFVPQISSDGRFCLLPTSSEFSPQSSRRVGRLEVLLLRIVRYGYPCRRIQTWCWSQWELNVRLSQEYCVPTCRLLRAGSIVLQ